MPRPRMDVPRPAGPLPLAQCSPETQEEVRLALLSPVPPPRWKSFGDSACHPMAQVQSRAYYEWKLVHQPPRVVSDLPRHVRDRERSRVNRQRIIARDGLMCGICQGAVETLADVHIDHIVAIARGGKSTDDNLRVTHRLCNIRKGAR